MTRIAAIGIAVVCFGLPTSTLAQTDAGSAAKPMTSCEGLSGSALAKCQKEAKRVKDADKHSGGDSGQSPGSGKDKKSKTAD